MKQVKTISFQRVYSLISIYLAENGRKEILALGVAFCLSFFTGSQNRVLFFSPLPLGLFLLLLLMIFASTTFSSLKGETAKTFYLMLPATAIEKLVANLFIVHVARLLLFAFLFILGLKAGSCFQSSFLQEDAAPLSIPGIISGITIENVLFVNALLSLFFFGSIYFIRHSFLKTMLAVFFIFSLFIILDMTMITFFAEQGSLNIHYTRSYSHEGKEIYTTHSILASLKIIKCTISSVTIFFFWVLSYFRLKEMEVR